MCWPLWPLVVMERQSIRSILCMGRSSHKGTICAGQILRGIQDASKVGVQDICSRQTDALTITCPTSIPSTTV